MSIRLRCDFNGIGTTKKLEHYLDKLLNKMPELYIYTKLIMGMRIVCQQKKMKTTNSYA